MTDLTVQGIDPDSQATSAPRRSTRGATAFAWWRKYCDPGNPRTDPATRARLRRAHSRLDVLRVAPAVLLARQLGAVPGNGPAPEWRLYAALDLARVLAHVKANDTRHPMQAAGWKHLPRGTNENDAGDERPRLSEARFRRLLETGDGEEKVLSFARLVVLLDGAVDVAQLSADFLNWNHPEYGDRVRERWAFYYFAAGNAAPPIPDSPNTTDTEDYTA